jgi:uncharacterized YigZ family protein
MLNISFLKESMKETMMKNYKTVGAEEAVEILIQKSRFIGHACPVTTEVEAADFIERIRKKHWHATHNVPVFLIGADYMVQRYSDDGEPSGTAGIPVMEMLKKEGITDICLVITRYFGGIKLGTGGLVRAYTDSAKAVLAAAGVIEKLVYQSVDMVFDYTLHGKIQNYCMNQPAVIVAETSFSDRVSMQLRIEPESYDQVIAQIIDMTASKVEMGETEQMYLTFKENQLIEM